MFSSDVTGREAEQGWPAQSQTRGVAASRDGSSANLAAGRREKLPAPVSHYPWPGELLGSIASRFQATNGQSHQALLEVHMRGTDHDKSADL